ncbi:hypothetical protein [Halosimplex pelagicum]|uniref:Uncharacterized protein n=1 Tax=Halosimplex pelagicum TaxID=869886 RepID=A0A7D5T3P2_9EURY|nr:hypothetical protein [Halosimplex pelagicum]QLH80888.1 hypothetical protein HZS54_04200 [Halosimplex pelagicum]
MIERVQIEFGFDSPIGSSELRSMLTELRQRTDDATGGELDTVLYIGAESEYLPEQISPSRAVDYVLEHSQGAIQFQYDGFHYLVQVNPSRPLDTVAERDSTDRVVVSVDGVYFTSDDAVDATKIADVVRLVEAHTTPDTIVGFGVDTRPGDPTPSVEWSGTDTGKSVPVHWLTFVPAGVTGVTVPSEIHDRRVLEGGALYFLADSPTSFEDIERLQRSMAATSPEG